MSVFNVAMQKRWSSRAYLDLMAGPGRCLEDQTGAEFDGSPLVALDLKVPFSTVTLVEGDPGLYNALRTRVGDRADVIHGDCNHPHVIARLRDKLGRGTLGFAFVDNLGLDVPLSTLAALSADRKLDLCITFQIGDLKRNLSRALKGLDESRWTAFFGRGWQDVARAADRRNISASDTATLLLEFYGEQLKALGYYVADSQHVMKNSKQVGLYRLVLAGKDPLAVKFFDDISKIKPGGQRGFQF
jgi:three-Cys-motif partner protein